MRSLLFTLLACGCSAAATEAIPSGQAGLVYESYTAACVIGADNVYSATFDHALSNMQGLACVTPHADYTAYVAAHGEPSQSNDWQPIPVTSDTVFCGVYRSDGSDHQLCDSITATEYP